MAALFVFFVPLGHRVVRGTWAISSPLESAAAWAFRWVVAAEGISLEILQRNEFAEGFALTVFCGVAVLFEQRNVVLASVAVDQECDNGQYDGEAPDDREIHIVVWCVKILKIKFET